MVPFRPLGSVCKVITWTSDTHIINSKLTKNTTSTQIFYNYDEYNEDDNDNENKPMWMDLMDQSQLIMTVIGLIANMATTLVLIKNGQVGRFIVQIYVIFPACIRR